MGSKLRKAAGAALCIAVCTGIAITGMALPARKPDHLQAPEPEKQNVSLDDFLEEVSSGRTSEVVTGAKQEKGPILLIIDKGETSSFMLCGIDYGHAQTKLAFILGGSVLPENADSAKSTNETQEAIPGQGKRLSDIYMESGADGASKALQLAFGIEQGPVAVIDMSDIGRLVQIAGEVRVKLSEEEAAALGIEEAGWENLDAQQAEAYANLTLVSDSPRTDRSRIILGAALAKAKLLSSAEQALILFWFIGNTATKNLDVKDLAVLAKGFGAYQTVEAAFPDYDKGDEAEMIYDSGSWSWKYDTGAAGERLRSFFKDRQDTADEKIKK